MTRKRLRGRGGATDQNGRSIIFLQSFVKGRTIETRPSERVPFQIVSVKKPKMSKPFWNVEQSTMKINPKKQLTLKILASIQSRGYR